MTVVGLALGMNMAADCEVCCLVTDELLLLLHDNGGVAQAGRAKSGKIAVRHERERESELADTVGRVRE